MVVLRELSRVVIHLFAAVQLKGEKREGVWFDGRLCLHKLLHLSHFAPYLKVTAGRTSVSEGTDYICRLLFVGDRILYVFFQLPSGVSKLRES